MSEMIIGIGSDMVDITRIQKIVERFSSRFAKRILCAKEIQALRQRKSMPAHFLAKRFAAKEAVVKALGTGFSQGITPRDIEIYTLQGGRPCVRMHGKAKEYLASLLPSDHVEKIALSLTDEYPFAQAFVIISANKKGTL